MSNRYRIFHTRCVECGRNTTKEHASAHNGKCALCVKVQSLQREVSREVRILEHGYMAYAIEEGHYDGLSNSDADYRDRD